MVFFNGVYLQKAQAIGIAHSEHGDQSQQQQQQQNDHLTSSTHMEMQISNIKHLDIYGMSESRVVERIPFGEFEKRRVGEGGGCAGPGDLKQTLRIYLRFKCVLLTLNVRTKHRPAAFCVCWGCVRGWCGGGLIGQRGFSPHREREVKPVGRFHQSENLDEIQLKPKINNLQAHLPSTPPITAPSNPHFTLAR